METDNFLNYSTVIFVFPGVIIITHRHPRSLAFAFCVSHIKANASVRE